MKIIKQLILGVSAVVALVLGVMVRPVSAGYKCENGQEVKNPAACAQQVDDKRTAENVVLNLINVVIGVLGIVAVVVIVIGGIQYATSTGDVGKVTQAKNVIMYGVIGLVIAMLAFAIMNFVLSSAFSSGETSEETSVGDGARVALVK